MSQGLQQRGRVVCVCVCVCVCVFVVEVEVEVDYRFVCGWELIQIAFQLMNDLPQRDFDCRVPPVLIGR